MYGTKLAQREMTQSFHVIRSLEIAFNVGRSGDFWTMKYHINNEMQRKKDFRFDGGARKFI